MTHHSPDNPHDDDLDGTQVRNHLEYLYIVSREEKEAFLSRFLTYTQSRFRLWRRILLFDALVASAAAIYGHAQLQNLIISTGIFLSVLLPLLAFHYMVNRHWAKHHAKTLVDQQGETFPIPHKVVVNETGMLISWSGKSFSLSFSRNLRIFHSQNWTDIIEIAERSGFGIPDHAFKDDREKADFIAFIEARIQDSTPSGQDLG